MFRGKVLKRAYVTGIRGLRLAAGKVGLLETLERRGKESKPALWLRSLFAIYDIEDMIVLDLPWWNLAAIKEVERFLETRAAHVFEFGSGASTIWLARRAASVVSIEHNPSWYKVVSERLGSYPNSRLKLIEPDAETIPGYVSNKPGWKGSSFNQYVTAIDREPGEYDLIVIDGRARGACLAHAAKRLASDGMILFDNSGRARYKAAIKGAGMRARTFRGATACLPYPDETTLLRGA